jgi:hypothetical protein
MENKFYEVRKELKNVKDITTLLEMTGLDWDVSAVEATYPNGAKVPNLKLIVKVVDGEPVYDEYLGKPTDRYNVISNKEAFDFLNTLIDDITFENAMELHNGKQVIISTNIGSRYVDAIGETVDCKMVVMHSYDGSTCLSVNIIPLAGDKPLNLPLTHQKRNYALKHTHNVKGKMKVANECLSLAKNYLDEFMTESNRLTNIPITKEGVERFAEFAFKMPADMKTEETKVKNVEKRRKELLKCIYETEMNSAMDFIIGVSDYVAKLEPEKESKGYQQNKFAKVIKGYDILDMAYKYVRNTK